MAGSSTHSHDKGTSHRTLSSDFAGVVLTYLVVLLLPCEDQLLTSESDVYGRHILTSEVGPRTERVKPDSSTYHLCETIYI